MGQYFRTINVTKKQYIHPHRIDNGAKALEQVGHMHSTSTALFALLANSNGRGGGDFPAHPLIGSWAGDQIVVQGDYAEPDDPGFVEGSEGFEDISPQVVELLDAISAEF